MKIQIKRFHYNFYRKLYITFVITISIVLFCISLGLYCYLSYQGKKDINESTKQGLLQSTFYLNQLETSISQIGYYLLTNSSIQDFFNTGNEDPIINYGASIEFNSIQAIYPFIDQFIIYNDKNQTMFSTQLGKKIDDNTKNYQTLYSAVDKQKNIQPITLNVSNKKEDFICFLYYPNRQSVLNNNALIISIKADYFKKQIYDIYPNELDEIVLLRNDYTIISSSYDTPADSRLKTEFTQSIIEGKQQSGFFTYHKDNNKKFIFYMESPNYNGYLICIRDYHWHMQNIERIRNVICIIAIGVLLVGIFISLKITSQLYLPVQKISKYINEIFIKDGNKNSNSNKFDEYKEIQNTLTRLNKDNITLSNNLYNFKKHQRDIYIRQLLEGSKVSIYEDNFPELKNHSFYLTFVSQLDMTIEPFENQKDIYNFAISNMLEDVFTISINNIILDSKVVSVLSADFLLEEDFVIQHILQVQEFFEREFQMSFSCGIGIIEKDIRDINISFQHALNNLNAVFNYGSGAIITVDMYERIKDITAKDLPSIDQLVSSLNRKNFEMKEFISSLDFVKSLYFTEGKQFLNELFDFILLRYKKECEQIFEQDSLLEHFCIEQNIYGNFNVAIQILERLIDSICKLRREDLSNRNDELINNLKEFIHKNYQNPLLSADLIAEHFNFSTGYLRKNFKSSEKIGLADYINQYRLNKAEELLLTTDDVVYKIAEKVGIENVAYFTTLFKKKNNLTPSVYRNQFKK